MRRIIYFEANDGTRFENERECVEYEHRTILTQYKDDFKIFNCHRQEMDIDDVSTIPDDIFYIIIKTPTAADVISDWFDYYGVCMPFEDYGGLQNAVGTWAYDDGYHSGCWYKVETKLDELQGVLAELKGE